MREVKCNNTLYNSYFSNFEYNFCNEQHTLENIEEGEDKRENVQEELLKLSRRFNIDLSPNIFYSRGKFIELLISSDTAKYCEFRMISQIMTKNDEAIIEKV